MKKIKRPQKRKDTVQIMDLKNIQENFEQQFKSIYDYIDEIAETEISTDEQQLTEKYWIVELEANIEESDIGYTKDLSYLNLDEVKIMIGKLMSDRFKYVPINFFNNDMYNYIYIGADNVLNYKSHWSGKLKVILIYTKK